MTREPGMSVVRSPEDATRQRKILIGILEAALLAYWRDELSQPSTARQRLVAGIVTDEACGRGDETRQPEACTAR